MQCFETGTVINNGSGYVFRNRNWNRNRNQIELQKVRWQVSKHQCCFILWFRYGAGTETVAGTGIVINSCSSATLEMLNWNYRTEPIESREYRTKCHEQLIFLTYIVLNFLEQLSFWGKFRKESVKQQQFSVLLSAFLSKNGFRIQIGLGPRHCFRFGLGSA